MWSVVTYVMLFTARQQDAVYIYSKSIRTSVCHSLVLYQNDSNYDHAVWSSLENSFMITFFVINFTTKSRSTVYRTSEEGRRMRVG